MQYLKTFFMNFNTILQTMWNAYFSCSKQTFYIIRMPISYSRASAGVIFKYTSLYYFLWQQRSIGQPKVIFLQISKNHNKKWIIKKKDLVSQCPPINNFYLLTSLEGMSTLIRSWASFVNQIWDVYLYNV